MASRSVITEVTNLRPPNSTDDPSVTNSAPVMELKENVGMHSYNAARLKEDFLSLSRMKNLQVKPLACQRHRRSATSICRAKRGSTCEIDCVSCESTGVQVRCIGIESSKANPTSSNHATEYVQRCDIIFAQERQKDARLTPRYYLTDNQANKRAAVVDMIMGHAASLRLPEVSPLSEVSRTSIQLAVSLFDRSRLVDFVPDTQEGLRCAAVFCLATALQFETPNSMVLESRLKKFFKLVRCIRHSFGISYWELQQGVLDRIGGVVFVPLPIEFAYYLLGKFDTDKSRTMANPRSVSLVCYLLDCFSLTPEACGTPASLAAASAIQLAKRISYPDLPPNEIWTPFMQELTGYTKTEMRRVLKTINSFLTTRSGDYPGLKLLHEIGWATVDWEVQ